MNNIEIEIYLNELQRSEFEFKNKNNAISINSITPKKADNLRLFKVLLFIIRSMVDYCQLLYKLRFSRSSFSGKRFVFTARNLCTEADGFLEDRIVKPLFSDNVVWINHSKEYFLDQINRSKVYNVGGVVKFLSLCRNISASRLMQIFLAYRMVNDSLVRNLDNNEVYTLCYYDLNGLSLAFSSHREKFRLFEVQHGSIINYPPYVMPSPIQIADVFYVKNRPTIEFLKNHLCKGYDPEYRLIPYPKCDRTYVPGIHLFYASTVEFNGLHPVFMNFLANNIEEKLHLIVRLHPREREKEHVFHDQLSKYDVDFEFDRSENWLVGNEITNMIVVSPWSSAIEDAYDNGFTAIIIDPVGKKRYSHLLDNKRCFYSDDLAKTLNNLNQALSEK